MTEVSIKPTIGRVVWYKERGLSDQFCDAHIVYVYNDNCINIAGFDRNGTPFARTSVILDHGPAAECIEYRACWMPYQKAAAAKDKTFGDKT